MLNLCCIVATILKMRSVEIFQYRESISTHISNFDDIGQCWIFAVLWRPFWKWRPIEICQCWDIIIYPHIKSWWYRTMLNFCGIVAAILKMVTGRNFSMSGINSGRWNRTIAILKMTAGRNFLMSGINSGHHNLPTYEIALKSDNVEFVRYCGSHFENGDR